MVPDPSESFRELRPYCLKLSKEPSQQNIKELESKLCTVEPTHLTQLLEYVLFPLKLALQNDNTSSAVKETAVGCIETLVRRGHVKQLATFEGVFSYLSMLLSCRENPGSLANISEELKLRIVNCLTGLLVNTSVVVKEAFYTPRFLPALGHTVTLLLALSEHEKYRSLQLSALGCLSSLACCDENIGWDASNENSTAKGDSDNKELLNSVKDLVAQTFASFIPGISMSLCRVLTGDPKQGHTVLTTIIDLWRDIMSLVMDDGHMPSQSSDDDVLTQLASVVMKNKTVDTQIHTAEKESDSQHSSQEEDKLKSLTVNRTIEWFQNTGSKLKILIERTSGISVHPNWKVRLSLAKFSEKLLINCFMSLQACVPVLVDVLVGLSRDEYSQVSLFSKAALQKLSQRLDSGPRPAGSLFEENLHSLLTALPHLMRTADDTRKIQALNLVVGYMILLGNRLNSLLHSSSHLKRLSLALVQVLEFDGADVGIVEERTPSFAETAVLPSETEGRNPLSYPSSQVVTSNYPKYNFKHFTNEKVKITVTHLCCLLGCYGNLALLADHFLDLFRESKVYQKQVVYILSAIVMGCAGQELEESCNPLSETCSNNTEGSKHEHICEIQKTVELLIAEYTSDSNWGLVTSNPPALHSSSIQDPHNLFVIQNTRKQTTGLPFEVLNSNIQLSCLFLEALGVFARVIGSEFDCYLMQVLYPIMAKLGDDNAAVSRSAYSTLIATCQACGYSSVDELIARNADYLVNSISLDIKYIFMNQQAPRVLFVMIQYSNSNILSIIHDTMMEIFSVIDLYPDKLMYILMKVLNVLVHMIQDWFPAPVKIKGVKKEEEVSSLQQANHNKIQADLDKEETKLSPEGIRQFFLDYHKRKQCALGNLDEADDVGDEPGIESTEPERGEEDEESFEPDQKVQVPQHVEYVTQVLEKCVHLLSSKSPWLRLLVLDTVQTGAKAISQTEDALLPMIHRIWPALIKRFNDDEKVVTIKAVNVLCTLAEASGSFMRRRVTKDALPTLTYFLDKQAPISLKAGPIYWQSQSFKLQLAILRSLGRLCRQLAIGEADLSSLVQTCSQYLSNQQPKELQEVAVVMFEDFALVEADLIWLSLNDLYCPEKPVPPCAMFKPVQPAGISPESREYAENVNTLLSKI